MTQTLDDSARGPALDPAPGAKPAKIRHRWRSMMTLTGVCAVDSSESSLISTLFPSIAQALHLNDSHLGLLNSVSKIVSIPAGPALSWVAGRIGRKRTVIILTGVAGLFGIFAGLSRGFPMLLVFSTLMSACIVGSGPIVNAILMDLFDDSERGKAAGYYYGSLSVISSLVGPLIAMLTTLNNGWRIGLFVVGGICLVATIPVMLLFHDPGIGASEPALAGLQKGKDAGSKVSFRAIGKLFKIPTFCLMMLSRFMSGHLLLSVFGIQFLVTERGFSNAQAALVLTPNGIGYFLGTVTGGWVVAWLDRVLPYRGRVWVIVGAQALFAIPAFFGTQIIWGSSIVPYLVFWGLMGWAQGLNPTVNRPMTAAVVLPEMRSLAFAIFITVFETLGTATFSFIGGRLADVYSIQTVFLWVLVGLMLANAALLCIMHVTYPRDARRMEQTLAQRAAAGEV